LAVGEVGDLVNVAGCFEHFVAVVVVGGVLVADLAFELALLASVEVSVLCDSVAGDVSVFGGGYVGGWGEMAALEVGVGVG